MILEHPIEQLYEEEEMLFPMARNILDAGALRQVANEFREIDSGLEDAP